MTTDSAVTRDTLGRELRLSPAQRSDRSRKAARASHSVSVYVRKIVANQDSLTGADRLALLQVVGATNAADAYAEGINDGILLLADKVRAALPVALPVRVPGATLTDLIASERS